MEAETRWSREKSEGEEDFDSAHKAEEGCDDPPTSTGEILAELEV